MWVLVQVVACRVLMGCCLTGLAWKGGVCQGGCCCGWVCVGQLLGAGCCSTVVYLAAECWVRVDAGVVFGHGSPCAGEQLGGS